MQNYSQKSECQTRPKKCTQIASVSNRNTKIIYTTAQTGKTKARESGVPCLLSTRWPRPRGRTHHIQTLPSLSPPPPRHPAASWTPTQVLNTNTVCWTRRANSQAIHIHHTYTTSSQSISLHIQPPWTLDLLNALYTKMTAPVLGIP